MERATGAIVQPIFPPTIILSGNCAPYSLPKEIFSFTPPNAIRVFESGARIRQLFMNVPLSDLEHKGIDEFVAFCEKQGALIPRVMEPFLLRILTYYERNGNKYLHDKAFCQLKEMIQFRSTFFPLKELDVKSIVNEGVIYTTGRDFEMRPLIIIRVDRLPNLWRTEYQYFVKSVCFCLEYVINYMLVPGKVETIQVLIDLRDVSLISAPISALKEIVSVLTKQYPFRMHRLTIVNSPWIMQSIFSVIKSFMTPAQQEKTRMVSEKEMLKEFRSQFHPGQLEVQYGGIRKPVSRFWPFPIAPGPFKPLSKESYLSFLKNTGVIKMKDTIENSTFDVSKVLIDNITHKNLIMRFNPPNNIFTFPTNPVAGEDCGNLHKSLNRTGFRGTTLHPKGTEALAGFTSHAAEMMRQAGIDPPDDALLAEEEGSIHSAGSSNFIPGDLTVEGNEDGLSSVAGGRDNFFGDDDEDDEDEDDDDMTDDEDDEDDDEKFFDDLAKIDEDEGINLGLEFDNRSQNSLTWHNTTNTTLNLISKSNNHSIRDDNNINNNNTNTNKALTLRQNTVAIPLTGQIIHGGEQDKSSSSIPNISLANNSNNNSRKQMPFFVPPLRVQDIGFSSSSLPSGGKLECNCGFHLDSVRRQIYLKKFNIMEQQQQQQQQQQFPLQQQLQIQLNQSDDQKFQQSNSVSVNFNDSNDTKNNNVTKNKSTFPPVALPQSSLPLTRATASSSSSIEQQPPIPIAFMRSIDLFVSHSNQKLEDDEEETLSSVLHGLPSCEDYRSPSILARRKRDALDAAKTVGVLTPIRLDEGQREMNDSENREMREPKAAETEKTKVAFITLKLADTQQLQTTGKTENTIVPNNNNNINNNNNNTTTSSGTKRVFSHGSTLSTGLFMRSHAVTCPLFRRSSVQSSCMDGSFNHSINSNHNQDDKNESLSAANINNNNNNQNNNNNSMLLNVEQPPTPDIIYQRGSRHLIGLPSPMQQHQQAFMAVQPVSVSGTKYSHFHRLIHWRFHRRERRRLRLEQQLQQESAQQFRSTERYSCNTAGNNPNEMDSNTTNSNAVLLVSQGDNNNNSNNNNNVNVQLNNSIDINDRGGGGYISQQNHHQQQQKQQDNSRSNGRKRLKRWWKRFKRRGNALFMMDNANDKGFARCVPHRNNRNSISTRSSNTNNKRRSNSTNVDDTEHENACCSHCVVM